MLGQSGTGDGQVIALIAGTVASILIILTTLRGWVRAYVDDRVGAVVEEKLGPLQSTMSRLQTKVAVQEARRNRP